MSNEQKGLPIKLKFVTEIRDGKRKETVAFDTNGLYYEKGKNRYLTFQEPHEQGEIKTIVKMYDDEVLIMRSGVVSMRQVYKKGHWTQGTYQNTLGQFSMDTKTDNVLVQWSEKTKKGSLFVTYQLLLQGNEAGRYTITINFKEDHHE
ncbi:DUF1934 domain-containing protein [Priestia taiwanensis]|uniref:DUF1934 domain-containing protein n=1 Tax=Priestia taiwanensis TaxID=1347902 RepID=A0A917AXW3_9BACI|nr:DUF1934 domain-containing protein [Priestia taiwanensis]MBM7364950.1 uncharacterized beta-barrel protein YwiB (DUF1934 family) [Priestia taiwanensis]GGE82289.1 hypothetical protein GCM10007140_34920 [Priestia taiwanensis]